MRIMTFWDKVDKSGGPEACWLFVGARSHGYGVLRVEGKLTQAHRHALELTLGESLGKSKACHTCDNPPCCNPAHLFRGTQSDNMKDAQRKGRWNGRPCKPRAPKPSQPISGIWRPRLQPSLALPVNILKTRASYGRRETLIAPIHGTGEAWIQSDALEQLVYPTATPQG